MSLEISNTNILNDITKMLVVIEYKSISLTYESAKQIIIEQKMK
ncbi:hypothetical protein [Clostridium estertheticum]|nr:hypothetical protein [Clostridium estertheticum]